MSKFARVAVTAVAVVGGFAIGGPLGAAIGGAIATVGANVVAPPRPKSSGGGEQTSFKADPNAGIPYPMGRTYVGGNIIYRKTHGAKNVYQSFVVVLGFAGAVPMQAIDAFYLDKTAHGVLAGGEVDIPDHGFMYERHQLGGTPAPALTGFWPGMPSWGSSSKLSGYAASLIQMKYDTKGKNTLVTTPECGWLGRWVSVYDPRKDSTYPGGSGPQRWNDETTWAYSENPYLHGLTWCIGRHLNGKRVIGLGAKIDQIIVADFVEGANVADANGWKLGGTIYSRPDTKWNSLKAMLQAGGGKPARVGARIGCTVSMPRVSLVTIAVGDIVGECSLPATQSRRNRINGVVPRYRSEDHGWEVVPAKVVRVDAYVTVDGDERTKEIEYSLVQNVDQAAQLAAYDIMDSREFGTATFPMRPAYLNYRSGDCITFPLDFPEDALRGQKMQIVTRSLDPSTGIVTMTMRSETDAKHAYALTRTGTPPATPSVGSVPYNPLGDAVSDTSSAIATSFPVGLTLSAAADGSITISNHTRRYIDGHADVVVTGTTIASGLAAGTFRAIGYDDADRVGGAVAYQLFADDLDARVSPDHPGRHYLGYVNIPTAGSPPSDGGGATPPGGRCVTVDTPVLLEDGTTKPAGELIVGDRLLTRHEERLGTIGGGWGVFPVEAIEIADSDDVWSAEIGGMELRATGDHRVWTGQWVDMRDIGTKVDGTFQIVKLTVTSAHTYVSNGVLSHNLKPTTD